MASTNICIACGVAHYTPEPTSPSVGTRLDRLEGQYGLLRVRLSELQNLVEYHLRREPVMDREIYRMQNVQGFGAAYWRLKNG